jgi:hypothetical protein
MLGSVVVDVAFPIRQLWGDPLTVLEPRLFLVGWTIWCGWVLWSGSVRICYVSSCQPLLPAGQTWELELTFLVNCFSFGSLWVSAHLLFLKGGGMFCLYQIVAGNTLLPHRLGQLSILPQPYQVEAKCFLHLWPPVLSRCSFWFMSICVLHDMDICWW